MEPIGDELTWDTLQVAKFAFTTPFHLTLKDGVFHSEKVLRIIPRKRLIAFGTWENKPVVAKIFFNHKRANRHFENELTGINALLQHHILTPEVYYKGTSLDDRIRVLIFERLVNVKTIEAIWQTRESIESIQPILESVLAHFAHHHEIGIKQNDPNLKNFMLFADNIYMIDAADIETQSSPISKIASMNNLAAFFAQFGPGLTLSLQNQLFRYYANLRGFNIDDNDVEQFDQLTKEYRLGRLKRLKKRIFKECRYFSRIKFRGHIGMLNRDYAAPELLNYLKKQMLYGVRANEKIIIRLDGREFVIKQYINSLFHSLLSCFCQSDACREWKASQLNYFHGTLPEKPIAFIEKRLFGLCVGSYSICAAAPAAICDP